MVMGWVSGTIVMGQTFRTHEFQDANENEFQVMQKMGQPETP